MSVTLDNLMRRIVDVTIFTSYERSVTVPLQMLSINEWESIGATVSEPVPPKTALDPHTGKPMINLADPDYQKARNKAARERMYRRLIASLEGGGITIPGETWDEKTEAILDMEAGIALALFEVMRDSVERARTAIVEKSESFHGLRANGNANMPKDGLDAGEVGGVGRGRTDQVAGV